MEKTFLLPGEMAFSREPAEISTLLGSCVAVCLFDRRRGWGGMNHYMVPSATLSSGMSAGKCGDQAIPALVRLATLAGAAPTDLEAWIYGGGAVVGHLGSVAGLDIGGRNITQARTSLQALGVPLRKAEVGGSRGRRLTMLTAEGTVAMRPIENSADSQARATLRSELAGRRIRVLIVDDSATVRQLLRRAIEGAEDLEVVGEAEDPFVARTMILEQDPDVLCLDVIMPNLDGLSFLKRLMQYKPIPVVIVSTIAKRGSEMRAKLEAAGAVAVLDKEELAIHQGLERARSALLPLLRSAAATPVTARLAPS